MNRFRPDPLSSEEREFATLMARIAPHGAPSPEIDARILSASHDAVAGPRARSARPRWPVAIGLAASMVLAVGVAWQLLPAAPEPGDAEAASGKAWSSADASAGQSAPPAQTPTASPSGVAADAPAAELQAPARDPAEAAPPAQPVVPSPKAPLAPVTLAEEAEPAATAPPQKNLAPPPSSQPAAPPVRPRGSPRKSISVDAADAQRQETLRQAPLSSARDAGSTAEGVAAPRRDLRVAPVSERAQASPAGSEAGRARERRTDLQVPVAADAQLQVNDWLERVRTRYGLGDEEAARRSLLLFVQDHPTEAVPGDLEPLLDE